MTKLVKYFMLLVTIYATEAEPTVEFVEDGARLIHTGYATFVHPYPVKLEFSRFKRCGGKLQLCYKSRSSNDLYSDCDAGYCLFFFNTALLPKNDAAIDTFFMDTIDSPMCPFVSSSNSEAHTFKILELPTQCSVKVVGATAPTASKSDTGTSDVIDSLFTTNEPENVTSSATTTVVIFIVVGVVGILLIGAAIGIIVYFFFVKPRTARSNIRQGETRGIPSNTSRPLESTVSSTPTTTEASKQKVEKKDAVLTVAMKPVQSAVTKNQVSATTVEKTVTEETPMTKRVEIANGLKVEKTQNSPTGSEGTPPTDHNLERSMKHQSMFRSKHYIPRTQTHVPYRRKRKMDSLEQLFPIAESTLASLERQKRISKTIQMVVAERWNLDVEHEMSKLEKQVLRNKIDIALDALDKMTAEIDALLIENNAFYGKNDSYEGTWKYVNQIDVPASAAYRLFIMSYPIVLEGINARLTDPVIAELSVPGLYALLMHDKFDRNFKGELLIEIRSRASILLRDVPLNNLLSSPFPLPYLGKRFKKDRANFIVGTDFKPNSTF